MCLLLVSRSPCRPTDPNQIWSKPLPPVLFTSVETAVSDSGANHDVLIVSLFTWGWLVRAQVRGRLVDDWPWSEDAPPLHGAPRSVSNVHAAAGRADAHVWPGAVKPAPVHKVPQSAYWTNDCARLTESLCVWVFVYLRCCFGELCGVLDGVDWAEEELSRSSLDSKLWICSFCTTKTRMSVKWKQVLPTLVGWRLDVHMVAVSGSHM